MTKSNSTEFQKTMVRYLLQVLFINLCCSCDLRPNTISEISGTWRTIEISTRFGDSITVEKPSRREARILIIRNDGVMLNRSGQVICCFPENYKVNGVLVEVKKNASVSDPLCKIFDCPSVGGLEVHKISNDSLRIKWGDGVIATYARGY